MALERKPAENKADPGYPSSDEYGADRRTFLMMMGGAAAAAVGLYAIKEKTMQGVPEGIPATPSITNTSVQAGGRPVVVPQVQPLGSILVQPQAQPLGSPAVPQATTMGKALDLSVQPQVAVPGGLRAPARPEAQIKGEAISPVLAPPVRPQAQVEGDVRVPRVARPEIQSKGGGRPVSAPAKPKTPDDQVDF